MARHSVTGLLPVDFFTQGYRISGHISTRAKTVGDTLNDRLSSYVQLQDVYIARVDNPGEIIISYSYAQLLKDNLLFAIVSAEESFSKAGRSVSYFGRQRRKAWLALATFEIAGYFVMTGRSADFEAYLAKGVDAYIPIQDGVAQLSGQPDISFSGEAFLINRTRIDLFCINPTM
jgi:hypothetical protein